jgi:hypothetical protein
MPDLGVQRLIRANRFRAHEMLFGHRHEYPFAPYHRQMVEDFWSGEWRHITLGFRECGKTTLVEEALTIAACEGWFRNCIIIGAKKDLAAELLTSIKVELDQNDELREVYGDVRGATWAENKITLKNGHCIQAIGRGQSLRGTKHLDWRPDLIIVNDFELDEEMLDAEGRRKILRWFLRVLLPACDRHRRRFRIYDTIRDAESVPLMLMREDWPTRMIPITTIGADDQETSSWPGHPSLTMEWIEYERELYARFGASDIWEREYMMNPGAQSDRQLQPARIEPRTRVWEAVYCMLDPARTTGPRSAGTGGAVWSWVQRRLHVWECWSRPLMPDEVVAQAFDWFDRYSPVWIGIEKNGLEEWLSQPIRHQQIERGRVIPYRAIAAPRDKLSFIRSLAPYLKEGSWQEDFPDLKREIGAFSPSSKKDALNALAYSIQMVPGLPVYEQFHSGVIVEDVLLDPSRPMWLALNAWGPIISGVLCQVFDGRLRIVADYVREGGLEEAQEIVSDAWLEAGRGGRLTLAPSHFEGGPARAIAAGCRQAGLPVVRAAEPERGRTWLATALSRLVRGFPAVEIAASALWTLNGLAGGYAYPVSARAQLGQEPERNAYRVVLEGLESLLGLIDMRAELDEYREGAHYRETTDGRRYISMLPGDYEPRPQKGEWIR